MSPVNTAAAQAKLAALIREDAQNAASPGGQIRKTADAMLGPYLAAEATVLRKKKGLHLTVDRLVDRAMKDAMKTWDKYNPPASPRNHALLSDKEVKAINKAKPNLGVLTIRAVDQVRAEMPIHDPARIPNVSLETAVSGITLSQDGDIFRIKVAATVPSGSSLTLKVDGLALPLTTMPGGINLYSLGLPEGYGSENVGSSKNSAGDTTSAVRIQKDLPGTMSTAQALEKARAGLIEFTKNERVKDSDWKDMIGMTWDEAVAHGVLDDIAKFAAPSPDGTSGVERRPDRYEFVGAGPLGLYTEASIRKSDGKLLRAYVEID